MDDVTQKAPTRADQLQVGLLVTYLFLFVGLVFFQNSNAYGWRMPGWMSVGLAVSGVVLLGWALWTLRRSR